MNSNILVSGSLLSSTLLGFRSEAPGHRAIAEAGFPRLNAKAKAAASKIFTCDSVQEITDIVSVGTWRDDIHRANDSNFIIGSLSLNRQAASTQPKWN